VLCSCRPRTAYGTPTTISWCHRARSQRVACLLGRCGLAVRLRGACLCALLESERHEVGEQARGVAGHPQHRKRARREAARRDGHARLAQPEIDCINRKNGAVTRQPVQ
jgi:hypothetical protein